MIEFKKLTEYNPDCLMIVDALNLAFRWKHSGAKEFANDYISTVQSLRKSYKAKYVIIACDEGSSSYRKQIYPDYKQNRKDKQSLQTSEEEQAFLAFIREFNNTLDLIRSDDLFPVLKFTGVEADDIGAYIVKKRKKFGFSNIQLISSDRDWDLLINSSVSRFSTVTRKEITIDNWDTHYECPIEEYISLKCLTGDSGDNIPGIVGVGPKKALSLIEQYGSAYDVAEALPIASKYKYIEAVNIFGKDNILRNYRLMDLLAYCEDALGNNTKKIDEIITNYIKKDCK